SVSIGAVAIAIAAIALIVIAWTRTSRAVPSHVDPARVVVPLPLDTELLEGASVAIAPDGSRIVYAASQGGISQLFIREMNSFDARPLPGTRLASNPFFSPDGQSVGFFAGSKLNKVSIAGGVVESLADPLPSGANQMAAWLPDGTIVFRGVGGFEQ